MRDSTKQTIFVSITTVGGFMSGIIRSLIKTKTDNLSINSMSISNVKDKISFGIAFFKGIVEVITTINKSSVNITMITSGIVTGGSGLSIGLFVVVLSKFLNKQTIQEHAQLQAQQRAIEGTYSRVASQLQPTQRELENLQTTHAEDLRRIRELEERNSQQASEIKKLQQQDTNINNPNKMFTGRPRHRSELQMPAAIPASPSLAMAKTG